MIWSAYLHTRPDGLQVLRVPILYDKWHQPEWATPVLDTGGVGLDPRRLSDGH